MSLQERRQRLEYCQKLMSEDDLHEFMKQAWSIVEPGFNFLDNWHLGAICEHLMAVSRRQIDNLLINVPPGTGKSLTVCVMWMVWEWVTRPQTRWMFSSYSEEYAIRDSLKCRRIIESEWYRARWGDVYKMTGDQNQKKKFENNQSGFRIASGIGGSTGEHPDIACIDGKALIQCRNEWKTIESIVNKGKCVEILSYSHRTGKAEWRKAIRFSKVAGRRSVKIKTVQGREIICTEDHPVFAEGKGYVAAGTVKKGQRMVATVSPLQVVFSAFKERRIKDVLLPFMLRELEPEKHGEVRNVREGVLENTSTRIKEQNRTPLLLQEVPRHWDNWQESSFVQGSGQKGMQTLSKSDVFASTEQQSALLFEKMPRRLSPFETKAIYYETMPCLWYVEKMAGDKNSEQQKSLLFKAMCRRGACRANERQRQQSLGWWKFYKTISERIPECKTGCEEARQESVYEVRYKTGGLQQGIGRSSHWIRQERQSDNQIDNIVPVLSRKDAWRESVTPLMGIDVVESIEATDTPSFVYNISVEVNNNYFANGILVHNCFDDPHKVNEAESDTERQSVIDWLDGVMATRGQIKGMRRVGVMQRLHAKDASGHLLDQGGWTHLCLPMRYEAPTRVVVGEIEKITPRMPVTPLGWQDPRKVDGELMWPSVYTEAKVQIIEARMGLYHAAGQMQQRPTPRGGGKFKREWFQIIIALPPLTKLVRYWDKAGTKGGSGAETAGVLMGEYFDESVAIQAFKTKYVIIDIVRGRWEAAEREAIIKQTAEADKAKYGNVDVWVEQEPGSGGKESAQGTVANLAGFTCSFDRVTGSKEVRADPLASQASVGKVKLLAAPWNAAFLEEAEMFPLGKLKDYIDGSSGAFNKMFVPTGAFSAASEMAVGSGPQFPGTGVTLPFPSLRPEDF